VGTDVDGQAIDTSYDSTVTDNGGTIDNAAL